MPKVLIEVRKQYSISEEIILIKAVHAAIEIAFKKPDDINIVLFPHEPHRFTAPPTLKNPELYTHVSIDCIIGRSLEAKRTLYRLIIENLEPFGIPKDHIKILLRENSKENWGIRGGQAACDVDLGYVIEI